jgi:hypothetical protein
MHTQDAAEKRLTDAAWHHDGVGQRGLVAEAQGAGDLKVVQISQKGGHAPASCLVLGSARVSIMVSGKWHEQARASTSHTQGARPRAKLARR